ncbi:hypothetical protein SASPL_118003 [Salvia splendens]|uniref:DNA-3-methyladenine glycosylase I n=1 Tax=Salvia splendens TaxID=180675 RepID=A0A8X8XWW4_SALSN|nr:hypothetical protein SASPL_118003 [Salvia splendens]
MSSSTLIQLLCQNRRTRKYCQLRAIIENARHVWSFDKYIWGFVNHKPIVSNFRYPCQVPIKTSKADTISKDLVRRGLRGVGPTVVYSFMQVAGITKDHLISCFKYHDCINVVGLKDSTEVTCKSEGKLAEDPAQLELSDDLNLSRLLQSEYGSRAHEEVAAPDAADVEGVRVVLALDQLEAMSGLRVGPVFDHGRERSAFYVGFEVAFCAGVE